MAALCNAKQSRDKKEAKFCEESPQQFEELVATRNKLNKKNPKYEPTETKCAIVVSVVFCQPSRSLLGLYIRIFQVSVN